jgi:hypothetical protein
VALITTFAFVECLRPRSLRQREARIAVLIAVGCLLATLANPYGWGLWQYLYENASVPSILTIAELQPPPLAPYRAFYFYVFVCVVVMARRWRELAVGQLVVFAAFAILGARYLRLTPLVLLASAPVVAEALGSIARPAIARRALVVGAVVATLALPRVPIHVLLSHLAIGSPAVQPAAFFSEDAIAFVESSGLKGYVFNSHNLGGYIAWRLYPQVRIFQDSRLQAYPPEHFLSILVASRSPADWDVLVADVNWAILSLPRPNQMSGVGRFRSDHWETAFNDGAVEIVVRRRLRTAAH